MGNKGKERTRSYLVQPPEEEFKLREGVKEEVLVQAFMNLKIQKES